jgi:hypothetical protein
LAVQRLPSRLALATRESDKLSSLHHYPFSSARNHQACGAHRAAESAAPRSDVAARRPRRLRFGHCHPTRSARRRCAEHDAGEGRATHRRAARRAWRGGGQHGLTVVRGGQGSSPRDVSPRRRPRGRGVPVEDGPSRVTPLRRPGGALERPRSASTIGSRVAYGCLSPDLRGIARHAAASRAPAAPHSCKPFGLVTA